MRIFTCKHCNNVVYFENTRCEKCGYSLGFLPAEKDLITLESTPSGSLKPKKGKGEFRYCANNGFGTCNWLIASEKPDAYCTACQLNHTIPDLQKQDRLLLWKKLEIAKHRLVYALLRLKLPVVSKGSDPEKGLAFDFLSDEDSQKKVVMGHENGLITINLNEADEVKRVTLREKLHEPYRTVLGHFRHEIGHYYWDLLISTDNHKLDEFRKLFGDERADYGEALKHHYASGPPADWANSYISAYATSHPWEDWAETWAHYMHVMDAVEIAWSFGLAIDPRDVNRKAQLGVTFKKDPYHDSDFRRIIDSWFPLTLAVNSLNRSMGQPDFYPFVTPLKVVEKMRFIHALCIKH